MKSESMKIIFSRILISAGKISSNDRLFYPLRKNTKGGNIMEKSFVCGMILGLLGGAILVTNSYKARKLVKDGQEEIKNKVSEMTEKKSGKKEDDYNELNG